MWKRCGRSSALDRAQVLLTAKKSGGQAPQHEPLTQLSVGGSAKAISAPPRTQPSLSDLSDLSSVSSVTEPPPRMASSPHAGHHGGREVDPSQDLGTPSLVEGRSRFLKKPPAPASSSQSPVSRIQSQLEPRHVASSQRSPQTAALRRLAEIESRVRSRKQAQDQSRQGTKPAPASDVSPPAAPRFPEAPVQLSTSSSGDQSPKGNRFLKKKASGAAPAGVGSRSNGAAAPAGGARREMMRVMSVSLESDEEDMRRLLGGSEDSLDNSPTGPGRTSTLKKWDEVSQRPPSTPPPPAAAPLCPPRSPPRHDSPFRFTGQAQARFSPSATSPSPPASPQHRAPSPQRSLSFPSVLSEVLSLEELFPAGLGSRGPNSTVSSMSEDVQPDFKINVMTLDDLVPAAVEFTPEAPSKTGESRYALSASRIMDRDQWLKEEEEEEEYPSDFESDSRSAAGHSDSLVSEHLLGDRGEGREASETAEKCLRTSAAGMTEDYSSASLDPSRSSASPLSDGSQTSFGGSACSESLSSHHTRRSRGRSQPPRRALKEAAVQTQPDPLAHTWLADAADGPPMDPTPVLTYTLSAEKVEALSSFNPALFALHEMLKQQLASTKTFVQSRRLLHSRLLQSLEPPNYRYTTLEDTMRLMQRRRPPKQTLEEALENVLQEMRDCQCT